MQGFLLESINRLNIEYSDLNETWGMDALFAKAIVKSSLKKEIEGKLGSIETCSYNDFIEEIVNHVI